MSVLERLCAALNYNVNHKLLRNGRFLVKLRISEKLKIDLLNYDATSLDQILPKSDITPFLRYNFSDSKIPQAENNESRYNLRPRT